MVFSEENFLNGFWRLERADGDTRGRLRSLGVCLVDRDERVLGGTAYRGLEGREIVGGVSGRWI